MLTEAHHINRTAVRPSEPCSGAMQPILGCCPPRICDDALEHAIGRSAFHTAHIAKILCEHLVLPPDMMVKVPFLGPSFRPCWAPPAPLTTIHHVMSTDDAAFNTSGYYWVKPVFLDIIHTMSCAAPTSIVYPYHRIRQLLYLYLASHINGATITRCKTVLVLKNDPLGSIFNVQALRFDQLDFFLRHQLILYNAQSGEYPLGCESLKS